MMINLRMGINFTHRAGFRLAHVEFLIFGKIILPKAHLLLLRPEFADMLVLIDELYKRTTFRSNRLPNVQIVWIYSAQFALLIFCKKQHSSIGLRRVQNDRPSAVNQWDNDP